MAVIAAALPEASLGRKWNAPSFAFGGRDLITLNHPPKGGQVRVIFHRGAGAKDTKTGARLLPEADARLTWPSDQRAIACFPFGQEIDERWLAATCRAWVDAVGIAP
ncbi:DUF1801 domain-containing protein [Maritimibacter sp. DP1N21-5]|uniref:DUF1801 domain-containing protein n=1 Tax=Maritimibacter sp. DP1N21-5 TaxID=2836867 RepID=UPI001C4460A5|nr:DUF1801 domain-containing protein [Maritimibacter sp. DP1N21-5]MBV7409275.1 DUF1801 domain-containing protein [Maritimibacter sp. DP1N21-5]